MSLYLQEQKLGSHSNEGGSSNKFILKGRQTGSMHRGHTWVFRAESHDTMMAWYEDIKTLTETTPEERSHFVRSHSRSLSQSSRRSASSDGMLDEDDADEEPFSASSQIDVNPNPKQDAMSRRSQPGGRFPSDIQVNAQRGLQAPHSPSSVESGTVEEQQRPSPGIVAAGGLPTGSYVGSQPQQYLGQEQQQQQQQQPERLGGYGARAGTPIDSMPSHAAVANHEAQQDGVNPYTSETLGQSTSSRQQDAYYIAPVLAGQETSQQYHDDAQPRYQQQESTNSAIYYNRTTPGSQNAFGSEATSPQHLNSGGRGNELPLAAFNSSSYPTTERVLEMEAPVPASEDASLLADTPTVASPPARPVDKTVRADSVQTISNLHIPGEYPRNSIA
jgi:hypothetical protein